MSINEGKSRLLWADSLKGVLMILVVIGHSIWFIYNDGHDANHIYNYIYSFHMPCFMAISGWLCFRPDETEIGIKSYGLLIHKEIYSISRRFRQLLIPYFCWSFMQALFLRGNFADIILNPNGYFWFLWVLFWIYVLFRLSKVIGIYPGGAETFSILLCLTLILILIVFNFRLFGSQFIAYYYIFYYFGYLFHKYNFQRYVNKPILLILFGLWVALGWDWSMHTLPLWMPTISLIPESVTQYLYRGGTAAIAIIVLLTVSPYILNRYSKTNFFICSIGRFSLGIYIIHVLIVKILNGYCPSFGDIIRGNLLLEVSFTLVLGLVSYLIIHLFMKSKYLALSIGKV